MTACRNNSRDRDHIPRLRIGPLCPIRKSTAEVVRRLYRLFTSRAWSGAHAASDLHFGLTFCSQHPLECSPATHFTLWRRFPVDNRSGRLLVKRTQSAVHEHELMLPSALQVRYGTTSLLSGSYTKLRTCPTSMRPRLPPTSHVGSVLVVARRTLLRARTVLLWGLS
ncbi:hypothetical protein BD311DRAFT_745413 [Dichomitus squalens]|uniref:Uncharacterized protein n=1 Tax=Dichomitus squalens TaxID=114155 RepID=A0A4Q9N468_9APHY|nr:hypothetical protein BD311DRAFT_745413 [Dichomitus squalens]